MVLMFRQWNTISQLVSATHQAFRASDTFAAVNVLNPCFVPIIPAWDPFKNLVHFSICRNTTRSEEARKEGRKEGSKEGRQEARKEEEQVRKTEKQEGRKGRKEDRKEGRQEGGKDCSSIFIDFHIFHLFSSRSASFA